MANEAGTIVGSAASGAAMGSVAGPWGTLIGGVLGAGLGVYQAYGQEEEKRPEYEVPDEIKQNLTQAQQQALQGLPAEQKQLFLSNLNRGTAYGLREMGSRKAGLTGLSTLNQQQNDAVAGLTVQDAMARERKQGELMNARSNMAQYKDQQFQINEISPYYERTAQNQAQLGANTQNIGNAIAGLSAQYGNTSRSNNNGSPYNGYGASPYDIGTSGSGYFDASYNPFSNVG